MKKILSLISLVAVLLAGGVLLGGCGRQLADQDNSADQVAVEQNIPATTTEDAVVVPEVTDASLEADLKALDSEMDTVKTTGFESTDLADKDLGL